MIRSILSGKVRSFSTGVAAIFCCCWRPSAAWPKAYTHRCFDPIGRELRRKVLATGKIVGPGAWHGTTGSSWWEPRVRSNASRICLNTLSTPAIPTLPRIPISYAPQIADLMLQAEIWSFNPSNGAWTMVFQSPLTIPVPNTSPTLMVPPDIGFRDMFIYEESNGTEALYVGGCSSQAIHPGVPGGRLLRSTDGVNFAPVPQDPGTFMGALDNTCFRGMQTLNGQFFAMAVDWKGQGTVIQSPTPWLGDNTFQQISSPVTPAYEIGIFNNLLYVTFVNRTTRDSLSPTPTRWALCRTPIRPSCRMAGTRHRMRTRLPSVCRYTTATFTWEETVCGMESLSRIKAPNCSASIVTTPGTWLLERRVRRLLGRKIHSAVWM